MSYCCIWEAERGENKDRERTRDPTNTRRMTTQSSRYLCRVTHRLFIPFTYSHPGLAVVTTEYKLSTFTIPQVRGCSDGYVAVVAGSGVGDTEY